MIKESEFLEYRKRAENYLKDFGLLSLNHFGIKTSDRKEYELYLSEVDEAVSEVIYKERRIATVRKGEYLLEILEPMPGEKIAQTFLDHISYISHNYQALSEQIGNSAISRFDVGNTHGFKIRAAEDIVIEIRNNDILDSIKDFTR